MVNGNTKTGFAFSLEDDAMDNMELVELLALTQGEDPLAITKIAETVLGKEGKQALYEHLRGIHGKVKVSAVMEEIEDIFKAFGTAGKKS